MSVYVVDPRQKMLGPYILNQVHPGDCLQLGAQLPSKSIDLIVSSPPYWGQRISKGVGVEDDPRVYLDELLQRFISLKRALKEDGLLWINLGDAYDTPVNWTPDCFVYSTLGPEKKGFHKDNVAYIKPRKKRKAFIDPKTPWLQYGNLLALPYRLVIGLCDAGFVFRGEVIWCKRNPMPEGKCRRPHRGHEGIYLFAKSERHHFQVHPPVKSVWEFAPDGLRGVRHFSRFPLELPMRCIQAYGRKGSDVVVLDPFSGSATTGIAALSLNCSYLGFEIDRSLVDGSNKELADYLIRGTVRRARTPHHDKTDQTLFEA